MQRQIKLFAQCYVNKLFLRQQIRVYHNGYAIDRATFYDFSDPYMQHLLKEAYESGRTKLKNGWYKSWVPGTSWGSFEKDLYRDNLFAFRLPPQAYRKLEAMSKDTFFELFDYN